MVKVGAATHPGSIRSSNEDYFLHAAVPQGYVGIVCDGVGGQVGGEVAAHLAAQAVYDFLREADPSTDPVSLMHDAILFANQRLILQGEHYPSGKAPASTIVAVLVMGRELIYGYVGDSRLYLYRKGELELLTEDDSLVQRMVTSGVLSPQQALQHPQKNVLTQSLGQQPPPTPHVKRIRVVPGSIYLLCSDGLSNALSREEMMEVLGDTSLSLQEKAEALVRRANQQGGYDNITALLLEPPAKTSIFAQLMNLRWPPPKYLIGGGIGMAVILLFALVIMRSRRTASSEPQGEILIIENGKVDTAASVPPVEETEPQPPEEIHSFSPPLSPPTELPALAEAPASKPQKASTPSEKKYFEYTIRKGDNLRKIAEIFDVSVRDLRQANSLKDDNIQAGKKLKIPVRSLHTHTVKEKETLSGIARRYGTRVEVIRRANSLESDKLRAGQKLIVPVIKK